MVIKYKGIPIEIECIWIPAGTVASGTISKSFRRYLSNIPGKQEVDELQKAAVLSTERILQKVLMWKHKAFNTCTIYCNYSIVAALHTLQICFVSDM
jgi:hypothetical protein